MDLQSQEKRLLELVRNEQERQCRELLQQADRQAQALLDDAWRSARDRLHRAVTGERERAREQLSRWRAAQETRRRLHRQQHDRALLDQGWQLLGERLAALWDERPARHRWIRRAARQALQGVPPNRWRIHHPPSWNAEDQLVLTDALGKALERPPEFVVERAISAGLLVRSGGVVLDMSLEGLTADRGLVEARLLALIDQVRAQPEAPEGPAGQAVGQTEADDDG